VSPTPAVVGADGSELLIGYIPDIAGRKECPLASPGNEQGTLDA
jgi:hypothetical protein